MHSDFLNRTTYIKGLCFPTESVVLYCESGNIIVSNDFSHKKHLPLKVICFEPQKKVWIKTEIRNDIKQIFWDIYRKNHKHKKYKPHQPNYKKMMSHERKKKKGSGGQFLYAVNTHTLTDYECSKNPLHDFSQSYYI